MAPEAFAKWASDRDQLLAATAQWSVGSDTVAYEVFGDIVALDVDGNNHLIILDEQAGAVTVFDQFGAFRGRFGDLGDGPSGLRDSWTLAAHPDGTIAVYLSGGYVKYFATTRNNEWHLVKSDVLPIQVESTCRFPRGSVYVHGAFGTGTALFYELGDTYGSMKPFGHRYLGDWSDDLIADNLSVGTLVCFNTSNSVVFAHRGLPIIQAFSGETASVLWVSRPDDYVQIRIEEYPQDEIARFFWFDGDQLASAIATPEGNLLVQYRRTEGSAGVSAIRTYLLDPRTGRGGVVSHALPVIAKIRRDGYFATFEDPFPRVEYRSWAVRNEHTGVIKDSLLNQGPKE